MSAVYVNVHVCVCLDELTSRPWCGRMYSRALDNHLHVPTCMWQYDKHPNSEKKTFKYLLYRSEPHVSDDVSSARLKFDGNGEVASETVTAESHPAPSPCRPANDSSFIVSKDFVITLF